MEEIINITGVPSTDFINQRSGKFRVVVKCRAGFMTVSDYEQTEAMKNDPSIILQMFKSKALQTVEFKPADSDPWLTVFARSGKKIHTIDNDILRTITVGTINSYFLDTTIYDQYQYEVVGATTHASKAFTQN